MYGITWLPVAQLQTEIPGSPVQGPDELSLQESLRVVQGGREGPAGDDTPAEALQTVEEGQAGDTQLQSPGPVFGWAGHTAVFLTQYLGGRFR